MLLYHQTSYRALSSILKDGYLLPSNITKNKNQNPYRKYLKSIFFNTIPNKKNYIIRLPSVGIIFDSSILINQLYYTNKKHTAGNIKTSSAYTYDNLKQINNNLSELFLYSYNIYKNLKKTRRDFKFYLIQVFQEVFILNNISIEHCKYILLAGQDINLEKLINKKYPHIVILYSKIYNKF